ncbi:MAG: zinc-ribbon domain-containing protein [Proteobacteria bacterium]|nr:zinc-ribbon domain-containing protein [Pseudomonadota bacterium]
MATIDLNFCPHCGAKLPGQANFCPGCGAQLGALASVAQGGQTVQPVSSFTTKHYLIILLLAVGIWIPIWFIQDARSGKKPTQTFEQTSMAQTQPADLGADIQRLTTAAKAAPQDYEAQQALAAALVNKLQDSERPSNDLIFAAMEAVGNVLKLKPDDANALIAMADISFNQQVFNKAADYYARYLGVQPNDNDARARYASALSFSGKFDDAIKELKGVLKKDPKNFHASAYLAITYAQMGKQPEAITAGEQALTLAPNEEARARFTNFLDEVKRPAKPAAQGEPAPDAANVRGNTTAALSQSPAATGTSGNAAEVLANVVRANSVAGPKFVEAKDQGQGVIALYFKEFPMEGMPPFVKDKFVNGIKLKAMDLNVSTLLFIDKDSGTEMVRAAVKGNS